MEGLEAIVFLCFLFLVYGSFQGWTVCIVLLIVSGFLFLGYAVIQNLKESRQKKEEEEKKRLEEEAFKKKCAEGKWEVPEDILYQKYQNQKINTFDGSYSLQKAKQILENIMKNAGVPNSFWALYTSDEQLKEYLENGRKRKMAEEERKRAEQIKKDNTPIPAKKTPKERAEKKHLDSLSTLHGVEKRVSMLKKNISEGKKRIKEIKQGRDAAYELSSIIVSSAHTQEKYDVAALSGIATAVSGKEVGNAVAKKAIEANERIEAENQKNKDYAMKLALSTIDATHSSYDEERQINSALKSFEKALKSAENKKVYDSVDANELFKHLKISASIIGGNRVSLDIYNSYSPDFPTGVKTVTDGFIKVEVLCDTIFVDEITVPISFGGVSSNGGKDSCYNYLNKIMPEKKKRRYTFKTSPGSLWLMEK